MNDFLIKFGQFARVLGIILMGCSATEFWEHSFFFTDWTRIFVYLLVSVLLMYRKNYYLPNLYLWFIALIFTFVWTGSYARMNGLGQLLIGLPALGFSLGTYEILIDIKDNVGYRQ